MKRKKIKEYLIVIISLVLIVSVGIIVSKSVDIKLLSNNSVLGSYYYCEDSNYKLSGTKCKKTMYTSSYLVGDVNHDNLIDVEDVSYIQLYLSKRRNLDEFDIRLSDINRDGIVDNTDVSIIQKYSTTEKYGESVNKIGTNGVVLEQSYQLGVDKLCPINYKYNKNKDYCVATDIKDAVKVEFIYGDINDDKKIDDLDYSLLNAYINGNNNLTERQIKIADINKDGVLNIDDLNLINDQIIKENEVKVILSNDRKNELDNLFIGDEVNFTASFKSTGNGKKYYKWFYVKSEDNIVESKCKIIENNSVDNYKITLDSKEEYVVLKTYSTNDCTSVIDEYKSEIINAKERPNYVNLEFKATNLKDSSTFIAKNTNIDFVTKFKVDGNNKYYYKRFAYKDDKTTDNFKCTLIENDMEESATLFVNSNNQYLKWNIYSDDVCKNIVNSFETEKYNSIGGLKINLSTNKVVVGENLNLSVITDSNIDNISDLIVWSSSNSEVAKVDKNGTVTGIKEGSVLISAKIGNVTTTTPINVVNEKVNIEYNLVNKNVTGNLVDKNTVLTYNAKFEVNSKNNYYYKWNAIKDGAVYNDAVCRKIKDKMELNPTLTINGANQHGEWVIYSDSSCKNVVNTYETKYFNYYADSISLNIKSINLSPSGRYKLNTLIKTRISNINNYVKWTSSNVSVATVDNLGNVTAKKAGVANITASIGNMSATATVNILKPGEDKSINCPLIEYDSNGSKTNIKITPNNDVKNYDIYLSTNNSTGSFANFEVYQKSVTGTKTINNWFKNRYSSQAKIVVYGKNGASRNCFTAPLTENNKTASLSNISCPTFKYSYKKSGNLYTYKKLNTKVTSGIDLMTVNFNLNREYQYSWYTSNKNGTYTLFKTYSTSSKDVAPTVTGQWYERNGKVLVTDSTGSYKICQTEQINNLRFNKTTYGNTDVYIESGFSSNNSSGIKNKISSFNRNNPHYLSVGKVFAYTSSTYNKIAPSGSCGFISERYVVVSDSKNGCNNIVGSLTHELGHGIDYMNGYVTNRIGKKYDIRDYTFNYNGSNTTISNYYSKYKSSYNLRTSYLRDYAFTNNEEFWAELFAYSEKGFKTDATLRNIRLKALEKYTSLYKNNKTTWNSIKEQYR